MKTPQEIELAFSYAFDTAKEVKIQSRSISGDIENIRIVMENNPNKIWWFAHEFMGNHDIKGNKFFIGYECSARLSQLAQNTDLIESRRIGRFKVRRYRFENITN